MRGNNADAARWDALKSSLGSGRRCKSNCRVSRIARNVDSDFGIRVMPSYASWEELGASPGCVESGRLDDASGRIAYICPQTAELRELPVLRHGLLGKLDVDVDVYPKSPSLVDPDDTNALQVNSVKFVALSKAYNQKVTRRVYRFWFLGIVASVCNGLLKVLDS